MRRVGLGLALLFSVGCSEYDLLGQGGGPERPVIEPEPNATLEPDLVPEEAPPEPSCADFAPPAWDWKANASFQDMADPTDADGRVFFDVDADLSAWAPIALPDRDIPTGDDRAYVTEFDLDTVPVNFSLNLQSDDGLWVWVNGEYLGNWGGDWQEEGCVNDNAQCLVTIQVPAVDITDLLVEGRNVIAARVSNPVANAYFEVLPLCVD